ncbi:MAG: hypothetical protein V4722_16790 [Bacteroidota bacterium]
MKELLQLEIIENNECRHRDLKFSIKGLIERQEFDTYFFAVQIDDFENLREIKNAVVNLLNYWAMETQNAKDDRPIYLPIDFSDEYTGCIRVLGQGDQVVLTYGFSHLEGHSVNPLNPGNYCNSISDFEMTVNQSIEVSKIDFLNSIAHQIRLLQNS